MDYQRLAQSTGGMLSKAYTFRYNNTQEKMRLLQAMKNANVNMSWVHDNMDSRVLSFVANKQIKYPGLVERYALIMPGKAMAGGYLSNLIQIEQAYQGIARVMSIDENGNHVFLLK